MNIKKDTKKAQQLIAALNRSEDVRLEDVYTRWSQAKAIAWNHCWNECQRDGGMHFRIVSHNLMTFTVGWIAPYGYRFETAYNTYIIQA